MKKIFIVIGVVMMFFVHMAFAYDVNSAVGYWAAVDDKTNKTSSIIKVWQDPKNQKYYGKIYRIFDENGHRASDHCQSCQGKTHGKPMLGLVIIQDMTYQNGRFVGGYVLDPRDGSKYHARMQVTNNGQLLSLRGYVGMPLLGRTAEWHRVNLNKS